MWKVTTAPSVEPISLAEAKLHLKLDSDTTDDTLITALITAAREQAEKYTGRSFIEQTITYKIEEFEDEDEVELPAPPLMSVTSVTYTDLNNTTQTLSSSVYSVDTYSEPGAIYLKYNQVWPSYLEVENGITIVYKAGYGATAASVPASIKAAMLLIIGHLYANREDTVTGVSVAELPLGSKYLLDPYRIETL